MQKADLEAYGSLHQPGLTQLEALWKMFVDGIDLEVVTKASMLAEFFFALAMLWWEGLRALKIDISS